MIANCGVDLRGEPGRESPLQLCLRWRHLPLVRFILERKVYSPSEVEAMFKEVTSEKLKAAVRASYPGVLGEKPRRRMSNFRIHV